MAERITLEPLQQSLKDLEGGYKNFFQKRAAFAALQKRGHSDAFRYPQGVNARSAQQSNIVAKVRVDTLSQQP